MIFKVEISNIRNYFVNDVLRLDNCLHLSIYKETPTFHLVRPHYNFHGSLYKSDLKQLFSRYYP